MGDGLGLFSPYCSRVDESQSSQKAELSKGIKSNVNATNDLIFSVVFSVTRCIKAWRSTTVRPPRSNIRDAARSHSD